MSNIQVVAIDGKIVMSVDGFKAINRQIRADAIDSLVDNAKQYAEEHYGVTNSKTAILSIEDLIQLKEQSNE